MLQTLKVPEDLFFEVKRRYIKMMLQNAIVKLINYFQTISFSNVDGIVKSNPILPNTDFL